MGGAGGRILEIRQLKYFVKIVETGSFSRAAEALYVAQPALSAQVAQLEQELQCQLLSRSSRGVRATPAGMQFYRGAVTTLKHVESLRMVGAQRSAQVAGNVVVGVPASAAALFAVPLLRRIRELHPAIRLSLIETPSAFIGDMLVQGRLDVSVLFENSAVRGISSLAVLEEDLFLIGSSLEGREASLCALDGMDMVMPAQPNSVRSLLDQACAASGVQLQMIAEISSPAIMLQLAREGLAATVLPWSVIGAQPAAERLSMIRLLDAGLQRRISVAHATDSPQTPAMLAVRSVLIETMQGLVREGIWKEARIL
jgi:DNA-binding transcriptional LysR family regulator